MRKGHWKGSKKGTKGKDIELFSEECLWVCCDRCQQLYDIECQKLSRKNIPEWFICK